MSLVWQTSTEIGQPTGIALLNDATVLAADFTGRQLRALDAQTGSPTVWSDQSSGAELSGAAGIALGADGTVYVADHDHYRVAMFDGTGKFMGSFGSRGAEPGQLDAPNGIAVAPDGRIFVSEDNNRRVQVFDRSGQAIATIDAPGDHEFGHPTGLVFTGDRLYVSDFELDCVWVFNTELDFLSSFGAHGAQPGQFDGMSLSAADGDGDIYLTDYKNGRIEVFNRDGAYLAMFGGDGLGFDRPYGVAVRSDGSVFVSDWARRSIERFDH